MAKSIIVYGVPGGKTRFAQRIADHFGLTLVPFGDGSRYLPDGHLYTAIWQKNNGVCEERSFQSIADEINASIPLTYRQSGPPPMVGEWEASYYSKTGIRSWWNGAVWSFSWSHGSSEASSLASHTTDPRDSYAILWRGLSQEPIKVTE